MMNWTQWLYDKIRNTTAITNIIPEARIYNRGTLKEVPEEKPFIVLRFDDNIPEIEEASFQDAVVWVHDYPGSYVRIDNILRELRLAIEGQVVAPDGVFAMWQGDSPDLADDVRGTIVRNSSFRLAGRR